MKNIPLEQQLSEIIEKFDWAKVEEVMLKLDWKWVNVNGVGGYSTPNRSQMERTAIHCLTLAWQHSNEHNVSCNCGTGGFRAECNLDSAGFYLRLAFEITDQSACAEELEKQSIAEIESQPSPSRAISLDL